MQEEGGIFCEEMESQDGRGDIQYIYIYMAALHGNLGNQSAINADRIYRMNRINITLKNSSIFIRILI